MTTIFILAILWFILNQRRLTDTADTTHPANKHTLDRTHCEVAVALFGPQIPYKMDEASKGICAEALGIGLEQNWNMRLRLAQICKSYTP